MSITVTYKSNVNKSGGMGQKGLLESVQSGGYGVVKILRAWVMVDIHGNRISRFLF